MKPNQRKLQFIIISLFLCALAGVSAEKISTNPWIGLEIGPVPVTVMEHFQVPEHRGVFIYNVGIGSPAQHSGILPGDILIMKDRELITEPKQLKGMIAETDPDTRITLSLLRLDHERVSHMSMSIQVSAGSREAEKIDNWPGFIPVVLPRTILEQLRIDESFGNVIVGSVNTAGSAVEAGLHTGDIIHSVEGRKVSNLVELYTFLNRGQPYVEMQVYRQGGNFILRLERRQAE